MVAMSTEEEARTTVDSLKGKCFHHQNQHSWIVADANSAEESMIVEIAHKEVLSEEEKRLKYEQRALKEIEDPKERQARCQQERRNRLVAYHEQLEASVQRENRELLVSSQRIESMRMRENNRCLDCWMLHKQCICTTTPQGSIIPIAFPPPQSQIYVADVEEDEKKFQEELRANADRTFVLFPSENSVTVQEMMETLNTKETVQNDSEGSLTIVLVDGTWQQARRLNQRIPSWVKRVKLMPRDLVDSRYKSPMRSQATPDRVCSLSAYVLLLQEMRVASEVCQYLLQLLHKKSEIVLSNSNK
ncbi:hypothetical protein GUITHDRAFT_135295 [Guillardia theta CCMP2712]|uniref:tRNA-uridine aminocarboxypropyltransferase n=1 Tax=Guillardia theta (strain CCMP2712) TaxID=905079 RepID=L1JPH5_GUITC|nr:hypothetical protein GUITHDRAFT_135295 [Guillardia theta CCMP2712]EKX50100.1 hypothetical protein GUITHDRAFT_135295 [Guillardia theta CCMP2712]|eukprot:XP_005837080.1 hypothetical protein GUITHDRAFT_135295 [Guillardia theta CCMP2712]